MKEYRVEWHQCPTAYHDKKVMFVRAACEDDAKVLVRDHVERKFGTEWFLVGKPTETKPLPAGEVLES